MMRTLILSCLALLSLSVQAQNMKAGLWEIKQIPELDSQRQAQLEEAQKRMAAMPPEQRKMMEQAMAQHGINVDMGAGGAITIKRCVSKEQAERNTPPLTDKGKCKHDVQRSGNVIHTHFSCTDPVSEGDSDVTLRGSDGFTSKTRITHQRGGRSETVNVSGEARWLGADCGELKPAATP
jgi:hypothetical protein